MKKLVLVLAAALVSLMAVAQTPVEILEKMDQTMNQGKNEGMAMTMTMKIPILGAFDTHVWTLGEKSRAETQMKGDKLVMWEDGTNVWTYKSSDNEITIEESKADHSSDAEEGLDILDGISEGYDFSIQKETEDTWFILCKKRKDNPNKDDPKKIELSVAKDTYILREMKTGMSGVTMIMKDFVFGVTEADVTFDPARYPDAKIVDKRGEEK